MAAIFLRPSEPLTSFAVSRSLRSLERVKSLTAFAVRGKSQRVRCCSTRSLQSAQQTTYSLPFTGGAAADSLPSHGASAKGILSDLLGRNRGHAAPDRLSRAGSDPDGAGPSQWLVASGALSLGGSDRADLQDRGGAGRLGARGQHRVRAAQRADRREPAVARNPDARGSAAQPHGCGGAPERTPEATVGHAAPA